MNIGELDSRITIQKKAVTLDAEYGTEVIAWATLATLWANVQDALPSRSESILGGSIEVSNLPTRIRIRWRSDVDSSMRIIVTHLAVDSLISMYRKGWVA